MGSRQYLVALAAIIFFMGSLALVNPSNLYISPDETANAYFTQTFDDFGAYQIEEFDESIQERLHPRSTLVSNGVLLPGSFLGLPVLYGVIVSIFGAWVLWVLTPLITIVTALAFGKLMEKFLGKLIGALSAVLFLLHPAVWYYSARGLMHNILFVDLLVLSVWLWVCRPIRSKWFNDSLAGLALGLSLFVRTSEFAWIGFALVAAGVFFFRNLSMKRLHIGLLGFLIGLALLLGMNSVIYGHPLTTGYTLGSVETVDLNLTDGDSLDALDLLPFGFHPRSAWKHFSNYGGAMFWWLSVLALLGLPIIWTHKKKTRNIRFVVIVGIIVSGWMVLMYGGWEIFDNPDPSQITMANSYVRYWLPMYILTIPAIAAAIVWISDRTRTKLANGLVIATLLIAIVGLNVNATFLQGQDGLLKVRETLRQSGEIQASVLRLTDARGVIIVDRADKIFFPHRRVMYPLREEATYDSMPLLLESVPLYYYGITFPEIDMEYLNGSRLERMGLQIKLIETYDQESLYKIFAQ